MRRAFFILKKKLQCLDIMTNLTILAKEMLTSYGGVVSSISLFCWDKEREIEGE
jgi:hypothetical protein